MTDVREQGLQVFGELLPGADVNLRDGKFGDELLEIGIDNVFGRLWGREGLSRRDRTSSRSASSSLCALPMS
jgi:4-carboxymuconolactone decarboxylase